MPVKHALLALLAQRDLTGYELKVRFERALGEFWQLNSGQVYSTLDRLRRGGLVHATRRGPAASSARAYAPALRADGGSCERWMTAPAPRLRPVRDPLYVKLVFSAPERVPALLASFVAETRRYGDAIETLARARRARADVALGTHALARRRGGPPAATRRSCGWLESVRRVLARGKRRRRRRDLRSERGATASRAAARAAGERRGARAARLTSCVRRPRLTGGLRKRVCGTRAEVPARRRDVPIRHRRGAIGRGPCERRTPPLARSSERRAPFA